MENGRVLDEQITASSELNDNSAAYQGRLNVNESAQGSTVESGAWVAGTSDQSQWLQVDLFDEESLISRVATQGRNQDVSWDLANSQWVERYKLQYSNDGRDFKYYHEQGKSTAKVGRNVNDLKSKPIRSMACFGWDGWIDTQP